MSKVLKSLKYVSTVFGDVKSKRLTVWTSEKGLYVKVEGVVLGGKCSVTLRFSHDSITIIDGSYDPRDHKSGKEISNG